jgi:hypothetical protein
MKWHGEILNNKEHFPATFNADEFQLRRFHLRQPVQPGRH